MWYCLDYLSFINRNASMFETVGVHIMTNMKSIIFNTKTAEANDY